MIFDLNLQWPLALLPLLALALILLKMAPSKPLRLDTIKATLIWGLILSTGTEILSLFKAITPLGLSLFWILVIVACSKGSKNLGSVTKGFKRPSWLWLSLFGFILGTTFIVAFVAAPNNWDSMTYHMARVQHWLLNKSLAHYPTSISRQLFLNPWAEKVILNLQVLAGDSDQFANLVQWFSFCGVMIVVSLIIRELGGSKFSQIFGALCAGSTPMIILQSTSTQNALACSFFIATAVLFALKVMQDPDRQSNSFFLALAVGLAIETKGIAYFFLPAFLVWTCWSLVRQKKWKPLLRLSLMGIVMVTVLNGPYSVRNYKIWKSPLGDPGTFSILRNDDFGLRALVSNIVRNAALHLTTPSSKINARLMTLTKLCHDKILHYDIDSRATTFLETHFEFNYVLAQEDYSGNPLQFILFFVALGLLWRLSRHDSKLWIFNLSVVMGFVFFCWMLKWEPWHSRLHTPLFTLVAVPLGLAGGILESNWGTRFGKGLCILAVVVALPWLLANYTRSLISFPEKRRWSVLTTPREMQYFTVRAPFYLPFASLMDQLERAPQCHHVGLKIGGDSWDYPFYRLAHLRHLDIKFHNIQVNGGDNPDQVCEIVVLEDDDGFIKKDLPYRDFAFQWGSGPIKLFSRPF